jgi:hypothetical protein
MLNYATPRFDSPPTRNSKRLASGRIVLCALLLAGSAAAQMSSNTITEPVLGLVVDAQAQTIRVLMGIPAASQVGASMDSGTPLGAVSIASERAYALAVEQDTGAAVLVTQSGRHGLTGVRAGALQTAVSPRGTAAALYFGDSGKALILTGLPNAPQVLREVTLDGAPAVLAVSDDGTGLAAVVLNPTTNDATVFSYSAPGAGQALLSDHRFSSLEFVPGGATLLLATETAVYLYQDGQGLQLLADQRDGIADVVGAAASGDGARVFIATRSGLVAVRNLAAATQTLISCSCQPAGMWRLRGNAVFRLNELGAGPVWLVDGGAADPRILFVAMPAGDNR